MKKLLLLTSALTLLGASIASAAAPGINLSWTNCATTTTTANYTIACDDNTLTRNLIASYRLAGALPDFVGVSIQIEYVVGDPGTPAWFQFGSGGCREGALAPISVGTLAGCTNSYAGTAGQAGGFVTDVLGPNRYRIRGDWARADPAPQTATTLYSALVLQMNTSNSFDEGFGFCAGCNVPACFVLKACEVYGLNTGLAANLQNADVRNWVTFQGGGFGAGCPGETPSKSATWGAVKALYR